MNAFALCIEQLKAARDALAQDDGALRQQMHSVNATPNQRRRIKKLWSSYQRKLREIDAEIARLEVRQNG